VFAAPKGLKYLRYKFRLSTIDVFFGQVLIQNLMSTFLTNYEIVFHSRPLTFSLLFQFLIH